jgi:aryl-alcohol dehydrogenase-like predicted oxidoreductase
MSLSNLGTDYLDIYGFHNAAFGQDNEYLEDAVAAMQRFKAEGKIRAVGQRGPHTYGPDRLAVGDTPKENKQDRFFDLVRIIRPDVIQVRYNILTPFESTAAVLDWAETHEVGVILNKPLAQGLLLDKYDPATPPVFSEGDHRLRKPWFLAAALRILHKRMELLKARFGQRTEDLVRVALQYCFARAQRAVVVVGIRNPNQATMNVSACATAPLLPEDVVFIQEVMRNVGTELGGFISCHPR